MGNRHQVEAKYLKPQGLYNRCQWDEKLLKKLILSKKLAPCYVGEQEQRDKTDECPICMLYYQGGMNLCSSCKQRICTECFLNIKKSPKEKVDCPFCNHTPFEVSFKGEKTNEERRKERDEEQRVLELQIRMRVEQQKIQEEERRQKENQPSAPPKETVSTPRDVNRTESLSSTNSQPVHIPPHLLEIIPIQYRDHINPHIICKLQELRDSITEDKIEQIMLEEALHESEILQSDSILPIVNRPSSSHTIPTVPPFVDYVNTFDLANFSHSSDQDEEQLRYALSLSVYEQ